MSIEEHIELLNKADQLDKALILIQKLQYELRYASIIGMGKGFSVMQLIMDSKDFLKNNGEEELP